MTEKSRDEELREVPLWVANRPWPKGVRGVGMKELDVLGVDRHGRLYWDGHPIEVREVSLRWPERSLAVAGIIVAVVAVVIQSWQWGCDLTWISSTWCPPQ